MVAGARAQEQPGLTRLANPREDSTLFVARSHTKTYLLEPCDLLGAQ
jgi:hypothetical protein